MRDPIVVLIAGYKKFYSEKRSLITYIKSHVLKTNNEEYYEFNDLYFEYRRALITMYEDMRQNYAYEIGRLNHMIVIEERRLTLLPKNIHKDEKKLILTDSKDTINRSRESIKKLRSVDFTTYLSNINNELNGELRYNELKYLKQIVEELFSKLISQSENGITSRPIQHKVKLYFDSSDTIELLFNKIKQYFSGKETEFMMALEGELLNEPLIFPGNQNKFVELFKRLKYNSKVLNQYNEINEWLCANFVFRFKRGEQEEYRPFNKKTINSILLKGTGEPPKRERISIDWLTYKSHETLISEGKS